jgi:hypothetical protein
MLPYTLTTVERTTVYLDAATKRLLKAAAQRRGVTEAQIIREALAEHLSAPGNAPRRPQAVGRSRDGGVARDLDQALKETGFGGRSRR